MTVAPDHQVVQVDGETFAVDYDPTQPGTYHFTWLTGPNPGYGFGSRISSHEREPQESLLDAISGFLAHIDPATGYLEEYDG